MQEIRFDLERYLKGLIHVYIFYWGLTHTNEQSSLSVEVEERIVHQELRHNICV